MNNNKIVKEYIKCVCDRMEFEYKEYNHDGFMEDLNLELAYLLRDKGIEKRIQKELFKRLNLKSEVQCEFYPVGYGKLYIHLSKDGYISTIKMPRELLERL